MCEIFFLSTSAQVALKLEMPSAKKLLKAPGQTRRIKATVAVAFLKRGYNGKKYSLDKLSFF